MSKPVILPVSPGASVEGSATQRAYLTIRRMIVIGELQPGEKLKIETLRSVLDTGASPIREALSLLTSDHLVERIDQRGFRAAPTSVENFEEILTLRCSLEDMALKQSISAATDSWEENLVLNHHRMEKLRGTDTEQFETAHKEFHMSLVANCPSPILLKFCSQLYDLNIRYRYIAGKSLRYKQRDVSGEHQQIMESALAHDAPRSSELLLTHYRQTGAFLSDLLMQK